MQLSAGDTVGPYKILASIGAGGKRAVFPAIDTQHVHSLAKVAGPLLARVPIAAWPAPVSRLTGVLTPLAMVPLRTTSSAGGANIRILFKILDDTESLGGDVAECGVWRGRTFVAMALRLQQRGSGRRIWGFDSFEGFDTDVPHNFKDTSADLVIAKINSFRLRNAEVVSGQFEDSFSKTSNRRFSFVHLDCDVYESYQQCLNFFYPRLLPGGVMLFDEYNDPDWPGAKQR